MNPFKKKSRSLQTFTDLWKRNDVELLRNSLISHNKEIALSILHRIDLSSFHMDDDLYKRLMDDGLYKEPILQSFIEKRWIDECMERDDPRLFARLFDLNQDVLKNTTILHTNATKIRRLLYNLGVSDIQSHSRRMLDDDVFECIAKSPETLLAGNIELEDKYKNNLLHYAVMHSKTDLIGLLIRDGVALNHKNMWSLTPLNEAVRIGSHEIASLLRDHGASLKTICDSTQSIIGRRRNFFHLLEDLMHIIPYIYEGREMVFQLFHSVSSKTYLYCCSLFFSSPSMRDFHDQIHGIVLDRYNHTLFRNELFEISMCHEKKQHEFFLAPLCHDHDVRHLYTFPFNSGKTFLGYFMFWTQSPIHDFARFSSFLHHFMRYEWNHCISMYPHIHPVFSGMKRFIQMAEMHKKNLSSPFSQDFIPAIRWWCIPDNNLDESIVRLITTQKDCHVPVSSITREIYELLQKMPNVRPDKSFLFAQMEELVFPQCPSIQSHSAVCLLRRIDLYEIIGSHHSDKINLQTVNEWIEMDWIGKEKMLFEKIHPLFGQESYRTSAVLGVEHAFSYRIFLPHYEIDRAMEFIFSYPDGNILVHFFRLYHCLVEWIHPLDDANGRSARLFLTILLRSLGFTCTIHTEYKILTFSQYYSFLKTYI